MSSSWSMTVSWNVATVLGRYWSNLSFLILYFEFFSVGFPWLSSWFQTSFWSSLRFMRAPNVRGVMNHPMECRTESLFNCSYDKSDTECGTYFFFNNTCGKYFNIWFVGVLLSSRSVIWEYTIICSRTVKDFICIFPRVVSQNVTYVNQTGWITNISHELRHGF